MNFSLLLQEIGKLFKNLSTAQKVVLTFFVTLLFAGLIALSFMSDKGQYSLLYSGLTPSDASKVTIELKSLHIPYKLANEGSVRVPSGKVYEARMELASKNLPSGGVVGFELFDKSNFGMTDFVQNINYQRALAGELTRTINSLNEVQSSRVQIAIPKPSIFVSEQKKSTASVVVSLNNPISSSHVRAIQHIVASAIPGMTVGDVTVVSSDGTMLSNSEGQAVDDEKIQYQKQIEQLLENKVRRLLTSIVGKKFSIAIKVDVDFNKINQQSVVYDPNSVPVSEQSTTEKSSKVVTSGIPGVVSNITSSPSVQSKLFPSSSNKKVTTNYDVGKTVTQSSEEPGKIKRISTAVVVDGTYITKKGKLIYQQRSASQMDKIQNLIASAIGYDKDRGDRLTVANIQFKLPKALPAIKVNAISNISSKINQFATPLRYLLSLVILIILYLFIAKPLLKNLSKPIAATSERIDSTIVGKRMSDIEDKIKRELAVESRLTVAQIKEKQVNENIKKEVDTAPEIAANIVKDLINE